MRALILFTTMEDTPQPTPEQLLEQASQGSIQAFERLYRQFHAQLKSYLYRMVANRNDAEDLAHDTFVKAYDRLGTFRGEASLKTWIFQIATRLAYDHLRKHQRWTPDTKARAKELCMNTPQVLNHIVAVSREAGENAFEMREHINHCFTCMGKTLPIEQQIAVILKDIYDFPVKDVAVILGQTEDVVKHLLRSGRGTLIDIFNHRCALINKQGVCHQCSELNGWFNPKQDQQQALNELDLVKGSRKYNRAQLFALRVQLIKALDPLSGQGADLQDALMQCDRMAMGEVPVPAP